MIVFLEAQGTNAYNRYAMCPAGHMLEETCCHSTKKKTLKEKNDN